MCSRWPPPSPRYDVRVVTEDKGQEGAAASILDPRNLLPFIIVCLIWGSTWLVIRDQVSAVPASWSVAYRFAIAALAMFLLAWARRVTLWIGWPGILFAAILGLMQFVLNFNLVYRAEMFLTSGLVAVLYALLLVPNSLLGWLFHGQRVNRTFMAGSAVAICGLALLFLHEYRVSVIDPVQVVIGIAFGVGGTLSASVANVMQGSRIAHRLPMLSVLAWAMLIGSLLDAGFAWIAYGAPTVDPRAGYAAGILYLAIAGSVVTFPLYYSLIQRIGAARAAYTSVLIPIIAMLLSTLFEGYRWSLLAAVGAALSLVGMVIAMRAKQGS
jgi:drug/metabolite transporter (DMT)-like permease